MKELFFLSRKNLRIALKRARLDPHGTDMVDFKTRFVIVQMSMGFVRYGSDLWGIRGTGTAPSTVNLDTR
jgi:hypothetical protein